jgi:CheY-like chemotaxis protein
MKTVLYAEDYPDDAFFMRRAFETLAPDSRLVVVNNGAEAIAYLAGEKPFEDRAANELPSLLLLDISMPEVNGFEVLDWMRSVPNVREIPAFVLTSSNKAEDRAKAASLGATGFLVKPSQPARLGEILGGLRNLLQ